LVEERAVAAIFKEYLQMKDMKVLRGENPDELTREHKKKVLRAINLVKLKNLKNKG